MTSTELAPGTQVSPNVRLVRPLASGAMGSVWVAEHRSLDIEVAVKFIRPEVWKENAAAQERFEREAKAAARIKSPHVVQTFDHGLMSDGTPYIVMELLDGETLGQRIARQGALDPEEVARMVAQTCRALGEAHRLGIVHRDVKPENLFLVKSDDGPFVKLLDFGVAKQTKMPESSATQTGAVVGTPQYMSPEMLLRAMAPDAHADLWALAVVAYHALTGVPPFAGETLAALIVAITHVKFERASRKNPRLSSSLDDWFDRALNLEPAARFASARELAESLAEAVGLSSSQVPSYEPSTPPEPTAPVAGTAEFIADQGLGIPPSQPEIIEPELAKRGGTLRLEPSRRRGRAGLWIGIVAGVLFTGGALAAFMLRGSAPPPPPPYSSGPPKRPATAIAPPSAALQTPPKLGLEPKVIDAGPGPGGRPWLPRFVVSRQLGDQGATYFEAYDSCRARSMALCTEAQWAKACAQVEGTELAQTETWTATAEGGRGFVVRGGAVGCMARKIARGSEASPERAGVCCDRAIAIAGGTDSASFMRSTADQLMEFERALNAADLKKLESLVDEHITMIDKSYDRAAWLGMVGARLRGLKAQWILHDTCEVAVIGSGDESKWSADCRVIIREDDRVAFLVRRYVRGGSAGKLQSIGEPEVYRTFGPL